MSSIVISGNTSGAITLAAPAIAGSNTLTLPLATDTLAGIAATQTLTNKTLVAPALGTPASGVLTNCTGVPAAALPAGSVLQVKNFQTGTLATGTTLIPYDNTIPQITEGTEFMTLAITPISASSKLQITVTANLSTGADGLLVCALFQDAVANALAVGMAYGLNGNNMVTTFSHTMTSGTTSATTFRLRAGQNNAGTNTFNGRGSAAFYGGTFASSITITEIAA